MWEAGQKEGKSGQGQREEGEWAGKMEGDGREREIRKGNERREGEGSGIRKGKGRNGRSRKEWTRA